ncbi:MAG TPA: LacI family DNA-binding transcriptional regulator [Ignavibacteriales bacterium]|nr:LacI family DNA-binding transcriptional regulator [Ignavibacteriales bacterium]
MLVTLNDIALKSGVSITTVSRVLNNKHEKYRISTETKKNVLKAAKDLRYRPNELARGLRLKKTHTVGLVVPDISNPFFAYITHTIQSYMYQSGYSLIICVTNENIETEIRQIDLLRSKGVDGYIIMPVGQKADHLQELLSYNKPLVLLDRCLEDMNANAVVVDNYAGAYKATEHLIENGHRRIAIVQGLLNTYTNNARLNGYKDALKDHNIPIQERYIVGNDFRKENGYIETKLLLSLTDPPSAIFTTSDLITLGAMQAIFEEKCTIPDDISIVAFDDIDFAPYLVSPLTVIRQPKELMGEVAVKLLTEEMKAKGKKDKKRIVLMPELVVRKSVRNILSN